MISKLKHIVFVLFVLMFVVETSGQNNSLSTYVLNKDISTNRTSHGYLSTNVVTAIDQDKNGMMWFGTKRGLNSYDSYGFEEYNQTDGVINATITDIRSVGDTLFVGTEKGLCIYDIKNKKTTNFFAEIDSLVIPDNHIFYISQPINGKVVICTKGGTSVYDLKSKKFRIPKINNYFPDYEVRSMEYVDYDGSWVVATSNGLVIYQDENQIIRHFNYIGNYDNALPSNDLKCMCKISDEMIFVGTSDGVCVLDAVNVSFKRINLNALTKNKSPKLDISNIIPFSDKEVMIATYTNGLYIYNYHDNTAIHISKFNVVNAISENYIYDIYKDEQGSVWIATFTGLNRLENNLANFSTVSIYENGSMLSINCFLEMQNNNILVGTESGIKVFNIDDKSIKDFKTFFNSKESYFESLYVYNFYLDENNCIWIGTRNNGLYVYDTKADKVVDVSERYGIDKLKHAVVRGTVKDEYENMWVATNMGVCRINLQDETHQFYVPRKNDKTSIPNYDIFDLLLDNESLYVTTGNGLAVYNYDSDDFTTYLLPDSLTQNDVVKNNGFFDIVDGENGRYYIGSYSNGMLSFLPDKKQFKATKAMGDLGTMVYAIVPDNKGNLWASTSKGIMKYQLDTKETMNYDVSDGLQGSEFSPNAFLKSKDGFVFFGGFSGFNYFKPGEIQLETRMPKTIITKMLTNEGKKYRYLTHGDTIHLSHKCKSFEIEFATLNLLRRNMVKYSYMLDNYDEDWEYCNSNHRYVDYNKMRPGTYVFKIKAANEVNQWTEEPVELTIIIHPAWYQRVSFNILVILLLSFAIFVVVRQRTKLVNQKREQKRIITELETQMLQLKQKTLQLQMNPHVIFNTLNSIQQYILNNDVEKAVSYLSSFSKLMRRILNNSNERYITLSDEIEAVSLYLQLESMRLGNRFSYEIEVDPEVDAKNIEIAPLIVQPFVENAIIHGLVPKKDNCFLSIRFSKLSEGKLLCVVEDNGVGRKHSEKMKQERGSSHKSYGMSITRRRLETLTKISNDDFSVEVIDLYDDNDMPSGTRVDIIISFYD